MEIDRPILDDVLDRFGVSASTARIEPIGRGLINQTYKVRLEVGGYILQRINEHVFPAPQRIQANLAVLTRAATLDPPAGLRVPALIHARDGLPYARLDSGFWRLMELIDHAETLDRIDTPETARDIGTILGRFHRFTARLDPSEFAITLPGFHDTARYLARFQSVRLQHAEAESDPRLARAAAFVLDHREIVDAASSLGARRARITHGDPKLDNMLFDIDTGRALGLIDLDTVQPGYIEQDIGDCLRSCCRRCGADAGDGAKFDLSVCQHILRGYAHVMRGELSLSEIESIYEGIRSIPYELGIRFLTDHLEGNRYFRVDTPGQNLEKALIQFALVEDIEGKRASIGQLLDVCFGREGAFPD